MAMTRLLDASKISNFCKRMMTNFWEIIIYTDYVAELSQYGLLNDSDTMQSNGSLIAELRQDHHFGITILDGWPGWRYKMAEGIKLIKLVYILFRSKFILYVRKLKLWMYFNIPTESIPQEQQRET